MLCVAVRRNYNNNTNSRESLMSRLRNWVQIVTGSKSKAVYGVFVRDGVEREAERVGNERQWQFLKDGERLYWYAVRASPRTNSKPWKEATKSSIKGPIIPQNWRPWLVESDWTFVRGARTLEALRENQG